MTVAKGQDRLDRQEKLGEEMMPPIRMKPLTFSLVGGLFFSFSSGKGKTDPINPVNPVQKN